MKKIFFIIFFVSINPLNCCEKFEELDVGCKKVVCSAEERDGQMTVQNISNQSRQVVTCLVDSEHKKLLEKFENEKKKLAEIVQKGIKERNEAIDRLSKGKPISDEEHLFMQNFSSPVSIFLTLIDDLPEAIKLQAKKHFLQADILVHRNSLTNEDVINLAADYLAQYGETRVTEHQTSGSLSWD